MTRRDVVRIIALYFAAIAGGTAIWIVLFHTPILAGAVLFYRGLVLLGISALLVAIGLVVAWRRTGFRGLIGLRDVLLATTLLVSVNALFFTHLPVTADRSISVYILGYLDRVDQPLTSGQIEEAVVDGYFIERQAIDKRLEEQLVTGTIVSSGEGYVLSPRGRTLVDLYELIASVFNIDSSNLSP